MTDTDFEIKSIIEDILHNNPHIDQVLLLTTVEKRLLAKGMKK